MQIEILKKECLNDNIPIIRDELIPFFKKIILKRKVSSILEVGTAYGYSSSIFFNINKNLKITTLEKDSKRYNKANQYLPKQINLLNIDAFEFDTKEKFDLIFIDGAKSKQKDLVLKYHNYLFNNGIIVIDNIFLNDLKKKELTKNRIKIIQRNEEFVNWLRNQNYFELEIIDIGDGVALLWKK